MDFLVTGGAGFIGSHLCEELADKGHDVIVIDDLSTGYESNLPKNKNIHLIKNKIQSLPGSVTTALDGIFHLAAQASVPVSIDNLYQSSTNNFESSIKVFDIARKLYIPVVYASSSAIYGNMPVGDDDADKYEILSPYALDKLTMERYARLCYELYNVKSAGLRFFNVYGPKQDPTSPYSGVISIFIENFIRKEQVVINEGYQTRDFIFVKDVVNVMIASMDSILSKRQCYCVNVGTGRSVTIDQLFDKLASIFNYRPVVEYKALDKSDPARSDGVFKNLRKILNIEPDDFVTFEKGLTDTVNYYLTQKKDERI